MHLLDPVLGEDFGGKGMKHRIHLNKSQRNICTLIKLLLLCSNFPPKKKRSSLKMQTGYMSQRPAAYQIPSAWHVPVKNQATSTTSPELQTSIRRTLFQFLLLLPILRNANLPTTPMFYTTCMLEDFCPVSSFESAAAPWAQHTVSFFPSAPF